MVAERARREPLHIASLAKAQTSKTKIVNRTKQRQARRAVAPMGVLRAFAAKAPHRPESLRLACAGVLCGSSLAVGLACLCLTRYT